jgi:hypothetical protein
MSCMGAYRRELAEHVVQTRTVAPTSHRSTVTRTPQLCVRCFSACGQVRKHVMGRSAPLPENAHWPLAQREEHDSLAMLSSAPQ